MKTFSNRSFLVCLGLLALTPAVASAQTCGFTQFDGNFIGQTTRVFADGRVARGDVSLSLVPDGHTLVSVFVLPASAGQPADYLHYNGQLDPMSRRGYVRLVSFDPRTGIGTKVPGAEKIPVFLFPDGRLVGGSIDAQGTATSFRATFVPLIQMPVVSSTP